VNLRIRWTTEASDQFVAAIKHIQQDNPEIARKVAQVLFDRIDQMATFPSLGRPGEVKELASLSASLRRPPQPLTIDQTAGVTTVVAPGIAERRAEKAARHEQTARRKPVYIPPRTR